MLHQEAIKQIAQQQVTEQAKAAGNKSGTILRCEPVKSNTYFCVAEVTWSNDKANPPTIYTEKWGVVVRNERATVFPEMDFAITEVIGKRWFFDFFSRDVVLTVISLIIVFTVVVSFFVSFFWKEKYSLNLPEVLSSAFTLVLGFWFGKQSG